jgi:hypothetical protein
VWDRKTSSVFFAVFQNFSAEVMPTMQLWPAAGSHSLTRGVYTVLGRWQGQLADDVSPYVYNIWVIRSYPKSIGHRSWNIFIFLQLTCWKWPKETIPEHSC